MNRIKRFIASIPNLPIVMGLVDWSKRHSMPGFYRLPLYNVVQFIWKEIHKQDLITRANSMAFSFFLSIFPSIIVLFTLIAYFPIFDNFSEVLREEIQSIMPNKAGDDLFNRIHSIATNQRGDLLSISFVLAAFFASNGMLAMMRGFEKSYTETFIKRNVFQKHAIAIQLTFLLAILLVLSVALIVLGNIFLNILYEYVKIDFLTGIAISLVRWLAILFLLYFGIATIYRFGIATRRKISMFSPGATLATILSLLASLLFSFYVDNFGKYHELYGPIGAIIVLMLWIQINSFSLLVGFELNASIAVNRDLLTEEGDRISRRKKRKKKKRTNALKRPSSQSDYPTSESSSIQNKE